MTHRRFPCRAPLAAVVAGGLLWSVGCSGGNGGGSGGSTADGPSEWSMLAHDYRSTFHNPSETKISTETASGLHQLWHFEAAGQVNGTPAVVGDIVYVTSTGGSYALDRNTGAVLWENLDVRANSSPTFVDGALYIHDTRANLRAVDAATGEQIWEAETDPHAFASGFSSPVVFERLVIVGASSVEEGAVAVGATFRGSVVAYDRDTGAELWRFYTEEPPYNGSSVWASVSIDVDTRRVYASTGNNYTGDSGPMSDTLFALDVDTGALVWAKQLKEGDVFTILNPQSPDSDFGTNPILFEARVGGTMRKLMGAGQKSGDFWVLDRETGEVIWERNLSSGSALIGGMLNNGAYDGERILVAGSDIARRNAMLYALNPSDGEILWQKPLPAWVWAPITVANGVGFVSTEKDLHVFDAATGDDLTVFPTQGTITSGATVADGRVYFGSGLAYIVGIPTRDFYALTLPGDEPAPPEPTPGPTPGADTTFSSIYTDIFVGAGCAGGSCHGAGAGNLSMGTQQEAFADLVDVPAEGPLCTGFGMRVAPGDPSASLLMNKISSPEPVCGDPMPIAEMLTPEQIERIRVWIELGAAND